jgi:hypothetical protein
MTLMALAAPRLVVALLWFFTHWFRGVFDNLLWPIIGFVFLPTTLLWYSAVHNWFGGHWTFWPVAGLVIALMIDLGPVSGRRMQSKRWKWRVDSPWPRQRSQPVDPAKFEVFADGFAGAVKQPDRAAHRPAGLTLGPDGAIYITDDQAGRVWKVTYKGSAK